MLFIAISLGFFVENYREVLVDRQKEKEIIASFINDLETDIKELDIVIQRRETREVRIDSIIYILNYTVLPSWYKQLIGGILFILVLYYYFSTELTEYGK